MMKTKITFFAFLLLTSTLFAQKFIQEWYIPLEVGDGYNCASAITHTSDGKLFISGWGHLEGYGNVYFMKADTAGQPVYISYTEEQYHDTRWISRVIINKQNNFVTIGDYWSYRERTFFNQISPDGVVLNTTINGGQYDYQGGNAIAQTADSGYLVATWYDDYYQGKSLAIRQLDKEGTFIFDTTFVDADTNMIGGRFTDIESINDSTFVLTGYRDYIPGSAEDFDYLLAKVEIREDTIHLTKLVVYQQDGTNERANDLLILPDDRGYIICGSEPNPNNTFTTVGSIFKTDTAGNMIWKKTYTSNLNSQTVFIRVQLDDNGDILVLANTQGGSGDISLLKYSLEGERLQKTHFDYVGRAGESAYDFTITAEGKIYIAGSLNGTGPVTALLLKVKDICPVHSPEASLENDQPVLGEDVVVHVQDTRDVWQYSLVLLKDSSVLATYTGNNGILDFTSPGLNNADVSEGMVVSVIEPGVDCYKNSDTLFPVFICPVETPSISLGNPTPNIGDDVVVNVANTNDTWEYSLLQIMGNVMLGTAMGNGSTYTFTVSDLTNEEVSEGLVVSAILPGFDECIEYSDTLYLEFVDGIEDIYQSSLNVAPNPGHGFITITDKEHKLAKLTVYNISGQPVLEENALSEHHKINLSVLPNGMYFFRITYREGMQVFRKVVKE